MHRFLFNRFDVDAHVNKSYKNRCRFTIVHTIRIGKNMLMYTTSVFYLTNDLL